MAYTENEIYENIQSGNVYIMPNIRGALSIINDYEYGTPSAYDITWGTLNADVVLGDDITNGYMYFKDGSYIRLELVPTWSTGTLHLVTNLAFNAYFGIKQEDETIEEILMTSVAGLPGYCPKYRWVLDPTPLDPDHGYWELEGNVAYIVGDTFQYSLGWWNSASPRFRYIFTCQTAGNGAYNIHEYDGLTWPILESGSQSGIQINTTDGQKIAAYLCGDSSEGTQYPGEDSGAGGGNGTFYNINDPVGLPSVPSLQAIDLGFTTLYNPNPADVRAIAAWLWSDDFNDNILMNYTDPLNNILGINFLAVDEGLIANEISNFVVGNCDSHIQTIKIPSGNKNQYLTLNCGDVTVPEYWQNFLDYNTTFQIWLPYIGFRTLKPEEVLQATEDSGGKLNVTYIIDLLTGVADCFIRSFIPDRLEPYKVIEHLLYSYTCNVYYNTPLSGANYMSMYNQQLNATVSGVSNVVSSARQIASGDIIGGITNLFTGQAQAKREYETAKPEYHRSGNSGGNSGFLSYKKPYIVKCQPIEQSPHDYAHLIGIPSMIYSKLKDLTGYTEIDSVIVDTLTHCTDSEKNQIINQLKNGIIIREVENNG